MKSRMCAATRSACARSAGVSGGRVVADAAEVIECNVANGSLTGKTVLITGGAKRVGATVARALHAAGANLAIHYRQSSREAEALAAELNGARPGSAALVQAELLDMAQLPGL